MSRFIIVFTDLDGTLLDHRDYSYAAAEPALAKMRADKIPLILCSSKTAAEISRLREELGFGHCPAIVENGGGILEARATRPTPAATHAQLLQMLNSLPVSLRQQFSGFSEWSPETLQAHTGLEPPQLELAAQRDYSEPGLWLGDAAAKAEFIAALEQLDVRAHQGGRFLTLGFATSKALLMQQIIADYHAEKNVEVTSITLGDAPNDIEMLQQADIGVIIPNPAHGGIRPLAGESTGRIVRANEAGPCGWNTTLLELLNNPNSLAEG